MIDAWIVDLVENPVAQREPDAAVATHGGTEAALRARRPARRNTRPARSKGICHWFRESGTNHLRPYGPDGPGRQRRRLRHCGKPIPHEAFPAFKVAVASRSHVRAGPAVGQTVSSHEVVQNQLAARRVHVCQASRLRQTETETGQVKIFAKESPLHALQCEQIQLGLPTQSEARGTPVSADTRTHNSPADRRSWFAGRGAHDFETKRVDSE